MASVKNLNLPREIIQSILLNLRFSSQEFELHELESSYKSLVKASLVCKSWHSTACHVLEKCFPPAPGTGQRLAQIKSYRDVLQALKDACSESNDSEPELKMDPKQIVSK